MVYLTSDLHFCHNREFIYKPRGFDSIQTHDYVVAENWNSIVNVDDDVYVLGDIMLNDNQAGKKLLSSLKGKIHIIRGNHDTDERMELYKKCWNVVEVENVIYPLIRNGYRFYLSHFPTMITENPNKKRIKDYLINLFGHTHQTEKFYKDIPWMYNVGLDAHNNYPIPIDNVIEDIQKKWGEFTKTIQKS